MTKDEFKRICKSQHMTQQQMCALLGHSRGMGYYGFPKLVVVMLRLLDDGTITPADIRRVTNGLGATRLLDDDPVRRAQ